MSGDERLGVVVLGMHRSGTSVAARLLHLLGLSLGPDDELLPAQADNPTGFWENAPLVQANEDILAALGGYWSAPPRLDEGWEDRRELDSLRTYAAELLRSMLQARQWAWKDPRTCLTFPFWAKLVEGRVLLVLVHRNPLEVVASLEARDGLSAAAGLALWERYARGTLAAARGRPAFVVSYERLLDDPVESCSRLDAFLRNHGARTRPAPPEEVHAFVRQDLRHTAFGRGALDDHPLVSEPLRALQAALHEASGAHEAFAAPELPPETAWVEPLLAERRSALRLDRELHERRAALAQAEARLAAIEASRSYRVTAPVRAFVSAIDRRRAACEPG